MTVAARRHARPDRAAGRRLRLRLRLDAAGIGRGAARRVGADRPIGACQPDSAASSRWRASPTAAASGRDATTTTAERITYPDIRLVYWAGGNPFHHHQDINRLRRAWQRPETIIVHEPCWTATARHADIVLPATTTLERNDIGARSSRPLRVRDAAGDRAGRARRATTSRSSPSSRAAARLRGGLHRRPRARWSGCAISTSRWREQAARQRVAHPGFRRVLGRRASSRCRARRRLRHAVAEFRADPEQARLRDAVRPDRDFLRAHRRLRLRRLPAASGLDRAGRMARLAAGRRYPLHLISNQPRYAAARPDRRRPGQPRRQGRGPRGGRDQSAGRRARAASPTATWCACSTSAAPASPARCVTDAMTPRRGAALLTGAWYDPDGRRRRDLRARQPQRAHARQGHVEARPGPEFATMLVEIERWNGPVPPVRAFDPPPSRG